MTDSAESSPGRAYRVWTIVLAVAVAVVAAGACVLAWQWSRATSEVDQLTSDLDAARLDAEARDATIGDLQHQVVQLRMTGDPVVVEAIAFVQTQVSDTACTQATDAFNAGTPAPAGSAVSAAVVQGAAAQRAVLAEVPGWEARLDPAAVDQRIAQCTEAADKAKQAEAAKAKAAKEAASTMWCPLEGRRVPKSYRGVCTEAQAMAEYEVETICYQSSDPEACFRRGGTGD